MAGLTTIEIEENFWRLRKIAIERMKELEEEISAARDYGADFCSECEYVRRLGWEESIEAGCNRECPANFCPGDGPNCPYFLSYRDYEESLSRLEAERDYLDEIVQTLDDARENFGEALR